jgi:osmotically-inducible protein OsmY
VKAEAHIVRAARLLCPAVAAALLLSGCAVAMLKGAAGSGSHENSQDTRSASQIAADDSISTAVRSKLAANPALKPFNLGVDTHDGVVTLQGVVAKVAERAAAERDARAVRGVKAVRNQLTVR